MVVLAVRFMAARARVVQDGIGEVRIRPASVDVVFLSSSALHDEQTERAVMVGVVSDIVLLLHETLTQSVRQDGGKDHDWNRL